MTLRQPPVIGIVGAIGSGKTTLAKFLVEHYGYEQITMSVTAKQMLYRLGLSEHDLEGPQAHRAAPHPFLCGKSPREAISALATAWGRELIGEDVWVNAMCNRVQSRGRGAKPVVIDGIRFPNEAEMIHRLGGKLIRLHRPEVEVPLTVFDRLYHAGPASLKPFVSYAARLCRRPVIHESEYHYRFMEADLHVDNTEGLLSLHTQVADYLRR